MGRADGPLRFRHAGFWRRSQNLGNAEVRDFHAAFFIQQDVVGLDVTVDDAGVVGELERLANLGDNLQRLARREFARPLELAQVQAVHILHDEKRHALDLAEFVDGDDVGMIQPGQGAGLAVEAFGKIRAPGGLRRENLERHDPVQHRLAGLINRPHAAFADQGENFELGKPGGHLGQ